MTPGAVEWIGRAALAPISPEETGGEEEEARLGHLVDNRRRAVTV
jgi:hypothetical protein